MSALRCLSICLFVALIAFGFSVMPVHAAAVAPTNLEQYMLELINRARANPVAEANAFNVDLNEGLPAGTISDTPKQPLAFNLNLNDSADKHSQWMLDNDIFAHAGADNSSPSQRAVDAGYELRAPWGVGENLGWKGRSSTIPDPYEYTTDLHEGLFVDAGIANRGHRTAMLNGNFKEVGVGIASGVFTNNGTNYNSVMISYDMAYSAGNAFLTGVVYNDYDQNNFYSPDGEGYGEISVRAFNRITGAVFETSTFSTGGYSLQVPAGDYQVTIGGENLLDTIYSNVTIGAQNVKLDLIDSPLLRPWSNSLNQFDVTGDGNVSPQDILVMVDDLNRNGARTLPGSYDSGISPYFLDVNRDQSISPADILRVVDYLNRQARGEFGGGGSMSGLLSSFESSDFNSVPEPTGFVLFLTSFVCWLTARRFRGKLSN